jgi:hypothetical protein
MTSQLLNPNNVHGGPFTTDPTGAVVNSRNTAFGHVGGSAAALNGEGLFKVTGGDGMPSSVQKQMGGSTCGANRVMAGGSTCGARMMAGGGRRRKNSGKRSRKNKRSRSSKRYARKRSLTYRMKHRRSRRHSRSRKVKGARRAQAGGYQQYMSNIPFSLGFRTPGFGLTSGTSALANPVPFMPYNSHD